MCIGMCTMFGGVVGIATMSLFCAYARLGAAISAAPNKTDVMREKFMSLSSVFLDLFEFGSNMGRCNRRYLTPRRGALSPTFLGLVVE